MTKWKIIPFYSNYEASDDGRIRNKKQKEISQQEDDTSVGTYLSVNIYDDEGNRKWVGVHRLVCLAYHGIPDNYPKIDTNHKDGDKHNNKKNNVEWMSRSDNVKHAYQIGLNDHVGKIKVTDHQKETTLMFPSMGEFCEYFGETRTLGMWLITRHRTNKYRDRYTFELMTYKSPNTGRGDVCLFDFANKNYYRASTVKELAYMTDLNSTTINKVLKSKKVKLIRGCLVWYATNLNYVDLIKSMPEEMINESLRRYKIHGGHKYKKRTTGYLLKDYRNGKIYEFRNLTQVAEFTGMRTQSFRTLIQRKNIRIFNGYAIKRKEDERNFLVYDEVTVKFSVAGTLSNTGRIIKVTDLSSNTTEYFPSLPVFAKTIGKNPETLRDKLKGNGLPGYEITFL